MMGRRGIGIDVGSDAVHVVVGEDRKGTFRVEQVVTVPLRGRDLPPERVGAAVREALGKVKAAPVLAGLTGRDVVIRYTQVPPVPDWQLRQLMQFEIKEIVEQSGDPLAADFNLIPVASDVSSDDTVLLALAKEGLLNARLQAAAAAFGEGNVRAFVPNAIALYNAFRRSGGDEGTVLLVNVGARNTDVAIARGGDILFARNSSGGGALFDDALVAAFNVSGEKARSLKEELADVAALQEGRSLQPQEEKVARALSGATGQILSMIQSAIAFARSQTGLQELKADRVLLSGGGALITGLDRYLEANLGVPVARFDPFGACDTAAVGAALDDATRATAVVALGLAQSAASTDVYSIEILPPALRRRRTFRERTVFAVLAGAVAVAVLAHDAWQSRKDEQSALVTSQKLEAKHRAEERAQRQYAEEGARGAELLTRHARIEERVTPGLALERSLVLLQRHLPEDLYVESIAITRVKEGATATELRPVIEVKGEGREGAMGLEQIFSAFAQHLGADALLGSAPVTQTRPAGPKNAFEWTLVMDFAARPPAPEGADPHEDDAEKGTR